MSINRFYIGYIFTLIVVMVLAFLKFSFLDVMAIIGTSLCGTLLIFLFGFLCWRLLVWFRRGIDYDDDVLRRLQ